MSLATTAESWCRDFRNTASGITSTISDIKKYTDTLIRDNATNRQEMSEKLRDNLRGHRIAIEKEVTNLLDGYASDRRAASAILAKCATA
ncbi:MAG: hypothetical protein M0Z41_05285 [Peptococcaceae bacterium]|jgi:hypothetical protein|nr:hypothetical protein [Peptococcaceae bacterium]